MKSLVIYILEKSTEQGTDSNKVNACIIFSNTLNQAILTEVTKNV